MDNLFDNKNKIYKKYIQDIGDGFCPFRKEFQMEVIESHLAEDLRNRKGLKILEACCGQGRFLYYLNKFAPNQQFTGFDYVRDFVEDAKKLFSDDKNISFFEADLYNLPDSLESQYDFVFLYKTLGYIPDYQRVIKNLIFLAKEKIYITASLYEGEIDFEIKIKPYKQMKSEDDYVIYYIMSKPRLKKFVRDLGVTGVNFYPMKFPDDLPKSNNPDELSTYTFRGENGENLEINNIIRLDWFLIEIDI